MANSDLFNHESLEDPESIAKYLDALKEGFLAGRLQFENEEGELRLKPRGLLECEIRARKKTGRVRVRLTISWRDDPADESAESFKIKVK